MEVIPGPGPARGPDPARDPDPARGPGAGPADRPAYAAAVFDLDGTLINTEPRNRVMWARLFERYGARYDPGLIASFAGRRNVEVFTELAHLFPGRRVDELVQEVLDFESAPDFPPAEPVPGAVELVRSIHLAGVPLGVVTSGQRAYAEGLLAELDIVDLLDVLVTADDVAEGKPDPEGFLAACRQLGVPPASAVAFEDAPAGVAAAKAAGMSCVGVATTQPPPLLAAADRVVPDLNEIRWPHVIGG